MRRRAIHTILAGLLALALLACEDDGPTGGGPSENLQGTWGKCFEATRCESVWDDGYRITADSFSFVELSGYENTPFQSDECEKCAQTGFTGWTYETVSRAAYSGQGDSLSFIGPDGEDVTLKFRGTGRVVEVTLRIANGEEGVVLTEHWTRLSGTFEELRAE